MIDFQIKENSMFRRREFLALAAAAPASSAIVNLDKVRVRKVGKVETVFKSPGPKPNGLQATTDGLWIMDQGNNKVYLVAYADGTVLREFGTEANAASGITFDGEALWLASTYSRELIRCSATTGKTISKHFTPGAGIIYRMTGDPAGRSSPLAPPPQPRPEGQRRTERQQVGGFQMGQVQGAAAPGTGGHGLEWRDSKLWVAVPPSRTVYRINPQTWVVEKQWPSAGNRPHGIGWEGKYLWVTDSNYNAFHKHDPETGDILEKIQLADSDPLPHGMTIWQSMMWYCDDVGVVCRLKL
jgi:sugar lactone lactonase YvrE